MNEIQHRKGQAHKNTDGLSRRQYESVSCEYCVKVEKKNMEELGKSIARIVFHLKIEFFIGNGERRILVKHLPAYCSPEAS